MNLPLSLTFTRLLTGPIFMSLYFFAQESFEGGTLAAILFVLLLIAEGTDFLDGYTARKLNQVTDMGKLLDPLADSLTHFSVFLTFTLDPISLPISLVILFFYRDSLIGFLRTLCALKGHALSARTSGKLKGFLQAVTCLTLTGSLFLFKTNTISLHQLQTLSFWLVSAIACYTLATFVDYFYANYPTIKSLFCSLSNTTPKHK